MTISYNWLAEYLPERVDPERLSRILTSIGLEVESLEKYESIKGGLRGLVIGEVLECVPHPNADKLRVTKVNVGGEAPLQIVCGAPNVAAGQKVVVATVGTTIYPSTGEPLTMKVAKIRGEESFGMICAEDEIGMGQSHAGIMVLPETAQVGQSATSYFQPYEDWIYEIGLTPNRMDAMSHYGVARDVCAYLTHHNNKDARVKSPFPSTFKPDQGGQPIEVHIENTDACQRYAGVSIKGVTVQESPQWLKDRLLAIGLRPINNIVDITNFVLHDTGQPLHAFDADAITGNTVIVKNMPAGTPFVTLDEKERRLDAEDLVIANAEGPMCIAGVFGGLYSGVKNTTTNIFLESAWFNPITTRRTSFRHGLRTDAATRFEKGVDISNTVNVLKRAALLIREIAGGEIASDIIDIYPNPEAKKQVALKYHYLKKLSGKNYHPDAVKRILTSLGFEIVKEGMDELWVAVPYSKPDISLGADIVEEILRIDGLDNIDIPTAITISPAIESLGFKEGMREKLAGYLVGKGFNEILTNSITNSKYFSEEVLAGSVKMINNLSVELDVLRPSMLETGLESIAYNSNRKNSNLLFFETGKTYHQSGVGNYSEKEHFCAYLTGNIVTDSWQGKAQAVDFYIAKGVAEALLQSAGIGNFSYVHKTQSKHAIELEVLAGKQTVATIIEVSREQLNAFDIKQQVYFIDIDFLLLLELAGQKKITYREVPRFPAVQRDLALVVPRSTTYEALQAVIAKTKLPKLQQVRLFDIFESDKLGPDKKSMAVNFTFQDEEKTLTDKEIDGMIGKLVAGFEKELSAEIRK
ncbi:phenylalanine--tRNA ligase subunit beta [Deminuibacter soli]|uniref:Phenylalanine--tRNA ligase beta subunit n=1 Tax=Deminuibacter soli TaxID=2291815 RepID=A0A3E1NPK9_9BACT|nr:phenylalanine--tRNA ligase subunit beta [Deminuibacter soli]RFM29837.1 phenylalanine--tRNA ligase subunit beta [Deminuibacter soli]